MTSDPRIELKGDYAQTFVKSVISVVPNCVLGLSRGFWEFFKWG